MLVSSVVSQKLTLQNFLNFWLLASSNSYLVPNKNALFIHEFLSQPMSDVFGLEFDK